LQSNASQKDVLGALAWKAWSLEVGIVELEDREAYTLNLRL
jgi:hypothetical protein